MAKVIGHHKPVGDGPMVVFTDKQLSECYVLDEAKDDK